MSPGQAALPLHFPECRVQSLMWPYRRPILEEAAQHQRNQSAHPHLFPLLMMTTMMIPSVLRHSASLRRCLLEAEQLEGSSLPLQIEKSSHQTRSAVVEQA